MVPVEDIVIPAGRPLADKLYLPTRRSSDLIVTGVIGKPWTAVMLMQVALTGGFTVTEQLTVPVWASLSVTLKVWLKLPLAGGVPEKEPGEDIVMPAGGAVRGKGEGGPRAPG